MSTRTTEERLDEMHERIDRLVGRAQATGAEGQASIKARVDALRRQEASTRAAVREARDAKAREVSEHANAAEDKLRQLETRLDTAEHALAAELADTKDAFNDSMDAYLDEVKGFFGRLEANASTKAGSAREQAEAAIADLRRSRDKVVERLAELRGAPGDHWRERKQDVAAARSELERKVDQASGKFE